MARLDTIEAPSVRSGLDGKKPLRSQDPEKDANLQRFIMTPSSRSAFVLGYLRHNPAPMIQWSVSLLEMGIESPSVVTLASLSGNEGISIIGHYFLMALDEQDESAGHPDEEEMLYALDLAMSVLDEGADVRAIARELAQLAVKFDYTEELNEWTHVDDEFDLADSGISTLDTANLRAREAALQAVRRKAGR